MPKLNAPLNDSLIKALKPKDKIYKKSDGENLYIFIKPNGVKVFQFEYKSPLTNKIRRYAIGNYPLISLKEAREIKFELQKMLKNKQDPLENNRNNNFISFENVCKEWIKRKKNSGLSKAYMQDIEGYFNRLFLPNFGQKDIKKITKQDIFDSLVDYEDRGCYEAIRKSLGQLSECFRYAMLKDYVEYDITSKIDRKTLIIKRKIEHYPILFLDNEIKALLYNMLNYNGDTRTKVAGFFSILTAQRPGNCRHAKWSDFYFEEKIWKIPSSNMKSRQIHLVHLSQQVVDLLENYRKVFKFNSDFLFPSLITNLKPISENTIRGMLRRLGYTNEELVPHGFRGMFSTICNEFRDIHQVSEDVIELCLSHVERNQIRAAYNHAQNLRQREKIMQWWADYLTKFCPEMQEFKNLIF